MRNPGRGRRTVSVVLAAAGVALMAGCTVEPTPKPITVAVNSPSAQPTSRPDALVPVAPKVVAQIGTRNTITSGQAMVVAERTGELYASGHNPNSVAVIDTESRRFVKRIPIDEPSDMAVDESTGRIYVATQDHEAERHSVHVIDMASHTVKQRFDLRGTDPGGGHRTSGLAVDPPNNHLFVFTWAWKPLVSVLDTKTGATVREIRLDGMPHDVAVDSKHGVAFVHLGSSITVIDTTALRIVDEIEQPPGAGAFAALAVHEDGAMLFAWSLPGKVTVIDTVSRKVLRTVAIEKGPGQVAFDRAARRAYLTRLDGFTVIDLTDLRVAELLTHPDRLGNFYGLGHNVLAVDPGTGEVYSTLCRRPQPGGRDDFGRILTVLARP